MKRASPHHGIRDAGGSASRGARPARRCRSTAFTLIELMVVIAIGTIVVLVAIPAFSSMVTSAEASRADAILQSTLQQGREAAIRLRGNPAADTAIVFFYQPGGRLTMVPCVWVGRLNDNPGNAAATDPVYRDVFVPAPGSSPAQLPKRWMVRGFAPSSLLRHTQAQFGPQRFWYEDGPSPRYNPNEDNWVFPETDFFKGNTAPDISAGEPGDLAFTLGGDSRQTFMVRFRAGTGAVEPTGASDALIVAPRPTVQGRTGPVLGDDQYRLDKSADLRRTVARILQNPLLPLADKRQLLGNASGDTVLARSVSSVALYDETRLAAALGARIDPETASLYARATSAQPGPRLATIAGQTGPQTSSRVRQWIEGDTNFSGQIEQPSVAGPPGVAPDAAEAKVFLIDRYTGQVHAVETSR